ncbi:hypothetical protein [Nostoc sp. C117]
MQATQQELTLEKVQQAVNAIVNVLTQEMPETNLTFSSIERFYRG